VRLIQITDTHLQADPEAELKGTNVRRSLMAVLDLVRKQERDFWGFLLTGDLSHDETPESYRALADLLAPFDRPAYALAGNHDDPAAMAEGFGTAVHTGRRHLMGDGWDLVMADTRVPGETGGALSNAELAALDDALKAGPDGPVLLALHHHPVPTGSAWMDAIALEKPERLMDLVVRHPRVRCVAWGHVHQAQDATLGRVRFLGTPATCIQFRPDCAEFTLDDAAPGYRRLDLRPDGALATKVRRLKDRP
jgi:3',5'-cyclic-AMP phosphodiesterase